MVTKERILSEIRRTAEANGGVALGRSRFAAETGIKEHDWSGRYWARWGDAVTEAGLPPNAMVARIGDQATLEALARAVRRYGRMPTEAEVRMFHREDPTFPSHGVIWRLGSRREQATKLAAMAKQRGWADVAHSLAPMVMNPDADEPASRPSAQTEVGEVYLITMGKHYKVGRTNAVGRREYELAIQLPERATTVHVIRTDDPPGIEAYWHRRFADRRRNGEWFTLTAADIAAFRRRKFM